MATHVIGGIHNGMTFAPTNGVAAHARRESEIAAIRMSGVKNARGRWLDQQAERIRRRHSKRH